MGVLKKKKEKYYKKIKNIKDKLAFKTGECQ